MAAARPKRRSPSKDAPNLTPAQRKKLLDAIRLGLAKDDAARLVGVARTTFQLWQQKGSQPDALPGYRKLVEDIDHALVEFEYLQLVYIDKAKPDQWVAAMTHLERKFPERYGRRTRVDSNVTVAAQPFIDTSKLTLEEQETLLRLLRKASPAAEELAEGQRPALELVAADVIDGEATEVA